MSSRAGHYPWWGFWRIVFVPVLIHSILLAIMTIGSIFSVPDSRGEIDWDLLSPTDAVAIYFSRPESTYPIIFAASILALIGFVCARKRNCNNHVLTAYVVLQLIIGLLLIGSMSYLVSRGYIHTHRISRRSWGIRDLQFISFIYAFISVPLFLLALRGLWVLTVGVPSAIDASGRYIHCISCHYDLRGTPGPTCPECGASVLAEKAGA